MMSTLEYFAPESRADLLGLLADRGQAAKLLAGGTDLLVDLRNNQLHSESIVNLKKVDGYSEISWSQEDGLKIGAAVTINDILRSALIHDSYAAARRLRAGPGVLPDP